MPNRTRIKYRGVFEDERGWSENEEVYTSPECDGCGSADDVTELTDDHGILVCPYCIEVGTIKYVDDPIINSDGTIGFRLEYSLQKPFLQDNNIIYRAFLEFGLNSVVIDYAGFAFDIRVQLDEADAIMFKLKNLENKILNRIRDAAF